MLLPTKYIQLLTYLKKTGGNFVLFKVHIYSKKRNNLSVYFVVMNLGLGAYP